MVSEYESLALRKVQAIAKKKGIEGVLSIASAKGKRFSIVVDGKKINFGSYPFLDGTFIDHSDEKIRENWRKRHSKIKLKNGTLAYLDKSSPEYYSWNLLW